MNVVDIDELNLISAQEYFKLPFGDRLRAVRLSRGFTLDELEKKSGLSRSVISGYELNKNQPGIFNLEVLCKSLDIGASALLGF